MQYRDTVENNGAWNLYSGRDTENTSDSGSILKDVTEISQECFQGCFDLKIRGTLHWDGQGHAWAEEG